MASGVALEEILNPFDEIKSQIFTEFNNLIHELEKRRTKLLHQLEKIQIEWTKNTDKHKQSINKLLEMKQSIEELSIKDNDVAQVYEASLRPILDSIFSLQEKIVFPNLKFETHDIRTVSELICVLGDLQNIPISTPVAKATPRKISDAPSAVLLKAYKFRNEPVKTISKSGPKYDIVDVKGVSFNSQNLQVFITSGGNNRVFSFKIDGDFSCVLGEDILVKPCGVYSCLQYCFVTDMQLNKVFKFDIHSRTLVKQKVSKNIVLKDQFQSPMGITGDVNQSTLYVFDSFNNRICCLPFNLTFVTSVIELKAGIYSQTEIHLFNDLLFLLEIGEDANCIHAYSREGEKMYSIVSKRSFSDVGNPKSFCLDSFGNFIISQSTDSPLRVFSNGGDFSCTIGSKKGSIPRCVCIANDHIVCAFTDGNVKIY